MKVIPKVDSQEVLHHSPRRENDNFDSPYKLKSDRKISPLAFEKKHEFLINHLSTKNDLEKNKLKNHFTRANIATGHGDDNSSIGS